MQTNSNSKKLFNKKRYLIFISIVFLVLKREILSVRVEERVKEAPETIKFWKYLKTAR